MNHIVGIIYIYSWLILFGACVGSFLNVVIYRLPEGKFFSSTRSQCPNCKQQLRWYDLLPVASYISLRGRCRYCNKPISPRYPLIELTCAVLAVSCYQYYGIHIKTPMVFLLVVLLLAITMIDFDTMEIPNSLILAIVPIAIGAVWIWPEILVTQRIIGFFVISVPMLVLTMAIEGAFGGGDIKLMAVCGFLLGWQQTLVAFFIALVVGGSYAIYLLASKKSEQGAHMAFGPYLCLGIIVSLVVGETILSYYLSLF